MNKPGRKFGNIVKEETKIKISNSLKGIKRKLLTEEHRKKIGLVAKGRKHTDEWKRLASIKRKGHIVTEETREKIRQKLSGHKVSNESRGKMRLAQLGKKKPWISIANKNRKKEDHYNWQGGKSFEEYGYNWTKELKQAIRQRDGYVCNICNNYPSFVVHHIDYNKKDCEPDNLITLCFRCHGKTNHNREY